MADELTPNEQIDALFADRPRGQHVRAVARGRVPLADDCVITIEQTLPDNAEAQPDGVRAQMEGAFHAAFGATAEHLDANGQPTHDLEAAIEVEITGDCDREAAAAAADQVVEIITRAIEQERARQGDALTAFLAQATEGDNGPTLL